MRALTALGLVTGCTLAFQVVFTRMLSSVLAYHFSFLAISLALLGTGAGALLVYVRPGLFDGRPLETTLARWSALYGGLLIVTPLVLVDLDYSINDGVTSTFAFNLTVACVLAAAPSLAAGAVVALAIRGWSDHLGRVYAWDLIGAGLGALVIVPLLYQPAPALIVALGVVACVASALFAWGDARIRRRSAGLAAMGLVLVAVSGASGVLFIRMPPNDQNGLASDEWHPLSRVQAVKTSGTPFSLLFYDRVFAPVPNVGRGSLPDWEDLLLGPASIGYEITGPGHALVIGGGGGRDIYNALASDQTVDVIELNSAIVDAVDGSLGDRSGKPYSREDVSTTIGDGRAILAASDETYDQIHIGFTDTLSANAAQGFALSENNLYTLEAFDEYFDHLAPEGILNVSRLEKLVGDEAIRATVLTMAALEERGIENPEDHIVVIRGTDVIGSFEAPYMTTLARLEPFTDAEVDRIRDLADDRADGIAFAPGGPYYRAWDDLAEAGDWQTFCNDYPLNVCPPTDDQPFFFNMRRLDGVFDEQSGYHYGVDPYQLLLLTLGILVLLSVAFLLAPLRFAQAGERPALPGLLFFAAIGLGFLLLETVLIQRFVLFLGFPTYSLSIVLFALLIFTGVGSAISGRLPHTRRTLMTVLGVAVGLIVVSAFTLQPLLRLLIDQPFPVRVGLSIAMLAPIGIALGHADAARPRPLLGPVPEQRGVRVGRQRDRVRAGVRSRHRDRHQLRLHRRLAGRGGVLRLRPRARGDGALEGTRGGRDRADPAAGAGDRPARGGAGLRSTRGAAGSGFVAPSPSPYDRGVLNRRLASLLVTVMAAALAISGCTSPGTAMSEQSAAVRVDDRTVSRSSFEDSLDLFYENDDLRGFLFQGVTKDQLRPVDGLRDAYTQEYVGAMAGVRVQFLVVAETLEAEGIEVTDDDRAAVRAELDGVIPEGIDSLPDGLGDDLVEGFAGFDRLRNELPDDEFNVVVGEVVDRSDISVSSLYGTWDDDEFAVLPPVGPAPAPGEPDESAPELAPG